MNRVRIEYAKGVLMALLTLVGLVICVAARTFDAAWMVFAFGALTWYFVVRARAFATIAARGCGQRPR